MGAINGKAFMSGNSVAVRLPKEIAFAPGTELVIERQGNVVTIRPALDAAEERRKWLQMLDDLAAMPKPPSIQTREPIEFPERPGL